ncbi:hypothetical protein AXF42_Ash016650 [Apostasia shenzhenica]|uniref:Uncharacterized protein n=1 Tax=Apostasia shenzhenica TaxID=1088818 RepID=A0A2I0A1N8_9ASPA|nr:hypothetical protein AXF42_Ash016650 [Apostasia shenzhenica]
MACPAGLLGSILLELSPRRRSCHRPVAAGENEPPRRRLRRESSARRRITPAKPFLVDRVGRRHFFLAGAIPTQVATNRHWGSTALRPVSFRSSILK